MATMLCPMLRQSLTKRLRVLLQPLVNFSFASVKTSWFEASITQRSFSTDLKIVTSPFNDVDIPQISLVDYIWQRLEEWPDKTAIECVVSGQSYSYAQLRERCHRFANSLLRARLRPGSVVGVVLPNMPDYPVAILGAVEAGFVATTVNPAYTADEIAKQLLDCDARIIVTFPEKYEQILKATLLAGRQGYKKPVIIITDNNERKGLPAGAVDIRDMLNDKVDISTCLGSTVDPLSPVIIPYSSGTMGLPKGVLLSHRNLIANSMQLHEYPALNVTEPTSGNYQDCILAVLPFFHIYGLVVNLLSKLHLGCKVVTLPKFEPNMFLNALQNHKANILYLAPPLVFFLGDYAKLTAEHLNSVRTVISGAAPLGEKDSERFLEKAPRNMGLVQGFGMTETSPVICHDVKASKKLSSVGPCVPNTQVKVIDVETGKSLGPGDRGEVCVKGPQVMLGYYNKPEETALMIDQSGWLHTGDIGYYDNDRDFYIVDRLKDLIKVKGYQVAPAELEELLRSHVDVLDAAVIGVPDERSGEAILTFIVRKPSTTSLKELEHKIKEFVAERVTNYKHLSHVRFVDSIPKSAAGKILRKNLKENP